MFYIYIVPLCLIVLWIFYLAAMSLQSAHKAGRMKKMHWLPKCIAYVVFLIACVLDALFNMTIFVLLLWDIPRLRSKPREWLLTERLERIIQEEDGRRGRLANWICAEWLNPFGQSGVHCK
jgi:hypothetical protein